MSRTSVLILALGFLFSGRVAAGAPALRCDRAVAMVPNRQFTLDIGPFQLHDGKACVHPTASDPSCEWDVTLTRTERWSAHQRFLLVVLNADHSLGSGAWDYVFVYRCVQNVYVPAFSERYLYGAKVEVGDPADLWITAGVWGPKDPTCCASMMRRSHLAWKERQKRFVVTESHVWTTQKSK